MSTAPSVAAGFELRGLDPRAALRFAQPRDGIDVDPRDRLGVLLGDTFDVDAALRGEHAEVLLGAAVERERRVVLLGDVGRVLDPDDLHDVALDVHAEDVPGVGADLGGVVGELDAAGFPAAADLHLRLHDDRIADAVGRGDRVVDRGHGLAGGDGNPVAREQLLALILEQIHAGKLMGGERTGGCEAAGRSPDRSGRDRGAGSSRASRASIPATQ